MVNFLENFRIKTCGGFGQSCAKNGVDDKVAMAKPVVERFKIICIDLINFHTDFLRDLRIEFCVGF